MKSRARRRATARYTWDRLKVSFWFAPLVMSVAAILLARAMRWVDLRIPNELLENSQVVLSGSVSELRTTLITISTTTLATAGVVFTLLRNGRTSHVSGDQRPFYGHDLPGSHRRGPGAVPPAGREKPQHP